MAPWTYGARSFESCDYREDDIDAEDYALVLLKGNNGLVSSFHFDFIGRLKKRGCEIVGTELRFVGKAKEKNPRARRSSCKLLITSKYFLKNIKLMQLYNIDKCYQSFLAMLKIFNH